VHQIRFRPGFAPDLAGERLAGVRGHTSKGKGGEGREGKEKGRRRERDEGKRNSAWIHP